jgi:Chain length determinant protein
MTTQNTKTSAVVSSDEIDLLALFRIFWSGKRTVIKYTLLSGMLALLFAMFVPNEYTAVTILVPSGNESSSKLGGLSGIGGLAAMAGININASAGSELSPILYPKIVSSLPFMLELMNSPLNFKELNKPVTLFEYYSEHYKPNPLIKYTLGIPGIIINAFQHQRKDVEIANISNEPLEISLNQRFVFQTLKNLVILEVDAKEGILTLKTTMPEPKAAAQLGQRAQLLLQKYITEFKIRKAKANLDFIQQRVDETTRKFEEAQQRLASFRDRNKNISLSTSKAEEERLSSQYNLIYGVYSDLSKQLEQSKIQVKQDTPVFTIIEPVSVPSKKSKPNRIVIIFMGLFIGGVIGTVSVFWNRFTSSVK